MGNDLTDKKFWANYWESKQNVAFEVPEKYTFHRLFKEVIGRENSRSAIELGGFPGYYAIFLKKYFGLQTTLFDFFIHQPILNSVLAANQLSQNDIGIIEGDLFQYQPQQQYDLVLSCGLIEHFNDTKDIISRHLPFLRPGGTLFITLPNFTGVNGWVQRRFDPDNYSKHNISSMDPQLLARISNELGLKEVRSFYYDKFSIWLENRAQQSTGVEALIKILWLSGKLATKLVPVETKQLSPYIVLIAKKEA